MVPWTESYWLVRFLFQRGLAVIYLMAFLVAANQFRPLAGEDGLLPIDEYAEGVAFEERPSLFHFVPDDRVIGVVAWVGVALVAGLWIATLTPTWSLLRLLGVLLVLLGVGGLAGGIWSEIDY